MTAYPPYPRLLKGSIVVLNSSGTIVSDIIPFQYNPESLSRTLQVQATSNEGGERMEALRLEGAPVETFKLDIEIDATDGLEKGQVSAVTLGIYPQLSALETLIYPTSGQVKKNMRLADKGSLEIVPMEAPMTLLVWGVQRLLPVRITDFSITEEAYDINLNPIRAKVSLGLRVLSYNDLPWKKRGSQLFMAHHKFKEGMARLNSITNLTS
ncbi:hypothetical protein Riv7116_5189 [Rivularia sp. PCC 7116]|uniref:CIS tube protein n=1 Tax=Rivularia sp. PCC 7116 TaxID=373994 RepID=UPI00029F1613|nr:hypothetical protein [Rivularia sp. PCC 7116]AFY57585.1 hypothetical protein Riv7116_5189 [Rivularia sp. PCC 7116]